MKEIPGMFHDSEADGEHSAMFGYQCQPVNCGHPDKIGRNDIDSDTGKTDAELKKGGKDMNISGINGGTPQTAPGKAGGAMDAESRNLQKQITDAQKKLQELAANGEISPEEKTKKRQEIQKEINDLRMQLRQHQVEVKRQEQAEKRASREAETGEQQKDGQQGTGFSAAGMEAVISADSSMKQAKVQNSVAVKMEGKAGVLEAEIKQDGRTGGNTSAKEAELAEVKQKAADASASQIKTLKEANRKMEAAGTEDSGKAKETDVKAEKEDDKNKEESKADRKDQAAEDADGASENAVEKAPGMYVDVRL